MVNTYEPCLSVAELNFLLASSARPSAGERARQVEMQVRGGMTTALLLLSSAITLFDLALLLRG